MKQKGPACRQAGQIILILIMVMTVALGIGLSIVQKSLVDISTASKVEQSSRAFSAAEAGIEKALGNVNITAPQPLDNSSTILPVQDSGAKPAAATGGNVQEPIEYPPLAKEDVVQVWLADPTSNLPNCDAGKVCYTQDRLDVHWGNSNTDKAALELTLVYYGTDPSDGQRKYLARKWYLDNGSRNPPNGFTPVACNSHIAGVNTYQCQYTISSLPSVLMLLRARLLYNTTSQPFAVQAVDTCNPGCSLPPQAREIISTGVAGETQRKVKVFQMKQVVPPFFDYALFSAGEISK